jgi:hypothetical protein
MNRLSAGLVVLGLSLASGIAVAKGAWSHNVSHRYSSKTSIKITEPKGFSVAVTIGDDVKKDTIPAIIPLPNEDQYLPVMVTAKDGHSWAEKVEIRAKQQTELSLTYVATKATPAKKGGRKYMGRLANAASSCGKAWKGRDVQFELVGTDSGDELGKWRFPGDGVKSVEIPAGSWDVRAYVKAKGSYHYYDTRTVEVKKDNFNIAIGCQKGAPKRPALLFK